MGTAIGPDIKWKLSSFSENYVTEKAACNGRPLFVNTKGIIIQ